MVDTRGWEEGRQCQEIFPLDAHEYIQGYGWHINPIALRQRLNEIDHTWSTSVPQIGQLSAGGLQALGGAQAITVSGTLTLLGATRSAVAAATVQRAEKQITADGLIKALRDAREVLLMGLAQQWNIGAYCKDIPSDITTSDQLEAWLGRE